MWRYGTHAPSPPSPLATSSDDDIADARAQTARRAQDAAFAPSDLSRSCSELSEGGRGERVRRGLDRLSRWARVQALERSERSV